MAWIGLILIIVVIAFASSFISETKKVRKRERGFTTCPKCGKRYEKIYVHECEK